MERYPDLAIRIDVEHEFVSPVAENYDIVFAMLEAPLPLDRDRDPPGVVAGARPRMPRLRCSNNSANRARCKTSRGCRC